MLNIKACGVAAGFVWAFFVAWTVGLVLFGGGTAPFEMVSQCYLGWIKPTGAGLVVGTVIGFFDGFVAGAVFAWIYNKLSR